MSAKWGHSFSRDQRGGCHVEFIVKGDGRIRVGREVEVGSMVIRGRIESYSVRPEYDGFATTFSVERVKTGRLIVSADLEAVEQIA